MQDDKVNNIIPQAVEEQQRLHASAATAMAPSPTPATNPHSPAAETAPAPKQKAGYFASGWPNFRFGTLDKYYPESRLFGYTAAGLFSLAARSIGKLLMSWDIKHGRQSGNIVLAHSMVNSQDLEKQLNGRNILTAEEDKYTNKAKRYVSWLETPIFLLLTTRHLFREKKKMVQYLGPAVAAELGLDENEVGWRQIMKSKNPFVVSVINRFNIQNTTRYATDLGFLINIYVGIVGKAFSITLERSAFLENLAYDKLRGMVDEVQNDNVGLNPVNRLMEGFVDSIQRSRRDNRKEVMTRAEISDISPILQTMAQAVVDRKMGVSEVIYMLGLGLDERNPAASVENLQKILTFGLREIALERRNDLEGGTVKTAEKAAAKPEYTISQPAIAQPAYQKILDNGPRNPLSRSLEGQPAILR